MNRKPGILLAAAILILLASCTKDRKLTSTLKTGSVVVNELLAKEGVGGGSDWIELYNSTTDSIHLSMDKTYLTDDSLIHDKFKILQDITIPAKGYYVVICDSRSLIDSVGRMHTNFNLSGSGEHAGVYYREDTALVELDYINFPAQTADISYGRSPDGSNFFTFFTSPTPGRANP
jgi:hypothetical protein